jgi:hypothetical protein
MKTIYGYEHDTHTICVSTLLSKAEKKELKLDANKYIAINEIGFKEPLNSESWEDNIFNVLISDDEDFDNVECKLFTIDKLPKRFKKTYNFWDKKRKLYKIA